MFELTAEQRAAIAHIVEWFKQAAHAIWDEAKRMVKESPLFQAMLKYYQYLNKKDRSPTTSGIKASHRPARTQHQVIDRKPRLVVARSHC